MNYSSSQAPDAGEQTIFDATQQIPDPQARSSYLKAACAGNATLRERIERLLRAGERADEFLAQNPLGALAQSDAVRETGRGVEGPGTIIGNYKLLEKLGEGGFGVVYMAEQKQPIKRRVALKIIKIGMDTREVVSRFEAERQALAVMDHPNIAKVFDAGATETPLPASGHPLPSSDEGSANPQLSPGRPYFVMELVRGVKITEYCDEKNLSTRKRLDLFTQVCQAVQHAHQKGIIHRDLKPSNILVTVNDGVAVPKIIDFGIAKATQMELTEKTVFTRFHQFLGTPAYMSPEQTEVTSVDIDTRSDIYSLGVLLYELLTGKTPFDTNELLKAGLDEMRRTIREKEPDRPSTRVSTLRGDELTTTAKRRGLDAPKLVNGLRADLDWIVMKCLEKDRARRYETANGLATDIQRHLNNEPVVACPPSNLYRFQKMVRRNKLAFVAGAGIAAALVIGLAIALWQSIEKTRAYNRAVSAEKAAQDEAAKSQQVAQFLKDMFAGAGPEVAKGRDATILLEILDQTIERLGRELTYQPAVKADLLDAMADVYVDLGRFGKAEALWREALALREKLPGSEYHVNKLFNNIALTLDNQGKPAEAEDLYRKSLAMQRKLLGKDSPDTATVLANLAYVLTKQGKLSEAKFRASESLTLMKDLLGDEDQRVAISLQALGEVEFRQRDFTNAENHFRGALAIHEKASVGQSVGLLTTRGSLANVLAAQNKLSAAETIYHEVLVLKRKLLGNDHPKVVKTLCGLGVTLSKQGKLLDAEKQYRDALESARKRPHDDTQGNRELGLVLPNYAYVLLGLGHLADARSLAEEAVALYRHHADWEVDGQFLAFKVLASARADQGNLVEAESLQSELLAIMRKRAPDEGKFAMVLAELAVTLIAERKFAAAEPVARECLEFRHGHYPEGWSPFSARVLLGESLLGQKKYGDAEPLLLAGYEGMKQRKDKIPSEPDLDFRRQPKLKRAIELLIQLYTETGRPDRAAKWKQKLAEFEKAEGQTKAGGSPAH